VSVLDDPNHVLGSSLLRQPKLESISQSLDRRLSLERRKSRFEHEVDGIDELLRVRSDGEEGLDGEFLEDSVALRVSASHEDDHLVVELEGVGFEFDSLNERAKRGRKGVRRERRTENERDVLLDRYRRGIRSLKERGERSQEGRKTSERKGASRTDRCERCALLRRS